MPFPVIKLGSIFVKQISKPLVNAFKSHAKSNIFFRKNICMPPAQFYHWMDTKLKMRLMGMGKVTEVKPLNEELAIELGAELLGEIIIFTIAAGTLYFEYWRQNRNNQLKEDEQNDQLAELTEKIMNLSLTIEQQETQMRELKRLFHSQKEPSLPGRLISVVTGSKGS